MSSPFLTAAEAATRLGIKPASLYVYVSRGLLRSEPGAGRARRYRTEEIDRLIAKRDGAVRFTKVTLRPRVVFALGADLVRAEKLHADARRFCFIANSVSFPVEHAPELSVEAP